MKKPPGLYGDEEAVSAEPGGLRFQNSGQCNAGGNQNGRNHGHRSGPAEPAADLPARHFAISRCHGLRLNQRGQQKSKVCYGTPDKLKVLRITVRQTCATVTQLLNTIACYRVKMGCVCIIVHGAKSFTFFGNSMPATSLDLRCGARGTAPMPAMSTCPANGKYRRTTGPPHA